MMKVVVCDGVCNECPLQGTQEITQDGIFRLTCGIIVLGNTCLGESKGINVIRI